MNIVCDELITTLTETITITSEKRLHISAVKIRVVYYNNPAGTFTLSVKKGADTLTSKSFTVADIKTDIGTSNAYGYCYKALEFDVPLMFEVDDAIDFELSHSGYTYSEGSFIAWAQSHEDIFNNRTDAFTNMLENPYDILIYTKKYGG